MFIAGSTGRAVQSRGVDEQQHPEQPNANAAPAPRPVLPVLPYEKPLVYRYKSELPPPGLVAKGFWVCCYFAGWAVGLVYRPRRPRQLYIRDP